VSFRILDGDCREQLETLPDQSINCVVTSPPYWGLRDYGVKGQLGLERTPDEYVAKIVDVFSEVRRVLRDDGTLWLNLGDCYATGAGKVGDHPGGGLRGARWKGERDDSKGRGTSKRCDGQGGHVYFGPKTQPNRLPLQGFKPKDLVGIPWMVAFALRGAGWYLRSDIIWAKPSPMPESVTDRPTKSHEYIFLLSKSGRYYYDAEAIREPLSAGSIARLSQPNLENQRGSERAHAGGKSNGRMKAVKRSSGSSRPQYVRALELAAEHGLTQAHFDAIRACGITDNGKNSQVQNGAGRNTDENLRLAAEAKAVLGGYYREFMASDGRNKRTVWTVAAQPFKDVHFATFPPKLIEPCVLAGAPRGGVVLDPFSGAGTTGLVCSRLGRDYIGIELNPEYAAMSRRRIAGDAPLFEEGIA
jgi:DNA modification methylase